MPHPGEIAALKSRHGTKSVLFASTNRALCRAPKVGELEIACRPKLRFPSELGPLIRTATGPSSCTSSAKHVNFQRGWVP